VTEREPGDPQYGHPRRWFVLAASSTGALLAVIMATGVNVAMPSLVHAFESDFPAVQWVVLVYLLVTSVLLPIVGRLGDLLGKKTLFVAGFLVFGLGSLLCGLAPSIGLLIAFRTVQGVGSALLTALGLALVTDVFPSSERGRALGINGAAISSGVVIGPTVAGLVIDAASWQWVFFLNVPLALLGAMIAWRFVPRSQPAPGQRFDIPGAAALFTTLLAFMLALTSGQARGFADPLVLGLFAFGTAGLALFVWLQLRVPDPVVELRLFRNPDLSIGLATGLATFVAISGVIFLMPFYLEGVLGYSPRDVGLLMAVVPILLVVVAPLAGTLSDRIGPRPVTVAGLAFILIGYLLVGTLDEDTSAAGYLLRFVFVGLGMGTFQSPNNSAIMGSVPRERSGVAGGLLSFTRSLGQTAGIAVLGTLWAARVAARTDGPVAADATRAPAAAQIAGLHDMMLVVQLTIALALALVVWDLLRKRARPDR
jgi:EmrB/QacA subfamily drug resistance transporter